MLNEEGGIDPEQFRMEAMFDRMDAIGKSMLGLTIQCAQCHTHKFDPLTQEEYYRLFAFLNNDHEAQRLVYTPDEMMTIERHAARDADDRGRLAAQARRLAGADGAVGRGDQDSECDRVDVCSSRAKPASRAAARRSPCSKITRCCARATRRRSAHYLVIGKTDLKNVTAIRLEALNDPNLPAGGPGRSFKGTFALDRVQSRGRAGRRTRTRSSSSKSRKATADFAQPETPLEPNFDDRSGKKRVVGPVEFAIDGKDETAWGIDAGTGRRNRTAKAVFVLEKPIEIDGGAQLTITLTQNHGGWNSDDHQNNLLGRFRISVTTAKTPTADPLPASVREILRCRATQRSPAQTAAVFSYWRTTVPEWKEANERIEALWKAVAGRAQRSSSLQRARRRATTHVLRARRLFKAGAKR